MRVITWNVRRATQSSPVWHLLSKLHPDIALLQEVGKIPENLKKSYKIISRNATYKKGKPQKFKTAILSKFDMSEFILSSKHEWVNKERDFFKGNLISCRVKQNKQEPINVISIYSPAWEIDPVRLKDVDISKIKRKGNSHIGLNTILWILLKEIKDLKLGRWIIGGDFNVSPTFDKDYPGGAPGLVIPGMKETFDRMDNLGLIECLKTHNE
jgi:exonuclease III